MKIINIDDCRVNDLLGLVISFGGNSPYGCACRSLRYRSFSHTIPCMIITIDGPAGSGKSTTARKLAARLDIAYLDTGAMYRGVAYEVLRQNVDTGDPEALLEVARGVDISLDCGPMKTTVRIAGQDVSDAIRSMKVSKATSAIASIQPIRDLLVSRQKNIGVELGSFVTEGRDQGSVVFPDADVKFVLDATPDRRARRRLEDLRVAGQEAQLDEVLAHFKYRDSIDEHQWEPLLKPGAAIRVDTTDMTLDEVVDELERQVRVRSAKSQPTLK